MNEFKKTKDMEDLEDVLLHSDDRDFQHCGGYLLLSHQISSLLKNNQREHGILVNKIKKLETESKEGDDKILESLEKINTNFDRSIHLLSEKIDQNKHSGDGRALGTESRLSSLETLTKEMKKEFTWTKRVVVGGMITIVLNYLGALEPIKIFFQSLF